MAILDGKKVAQEVLQKLKVKIKALPRAPAMAIVLVGDNPESKIYVNIKRKRSEEIGVNCTLHHFPETISQEELISRIDDLQQNVNGIIVQMPLPKMLDAQQVIDAILPEKDIDGLTQTNQGALVNGKENLVPATPKGVMRLLDAYNVEVRGKEVVLINKSILVGKPLLMLLLGRGATVTVCHSSTKDLAKHTKEADIIISATGVAGLIKAAMIREQAIVVDVGVSKKEGILRGDVDFENVQQKAQWITPVPGGVGPMTVAMLLENLVQATVAQQDRNT